MCNQYFYIKKEKKCFWINKNIIFLWLIHENAGILFWNFCKLKKNKITYIET